METQNENQSKPKQSPEDIVASANLPDMEMMSSKALNDYFNTLENGLEVAKALKKLGDKKVEAFRTELDKLLASHPEVGLAGVIVHDMPVGTVVNGFSHFHGDDSLGLKVAASLGELQTKVSNKALGKRPSFADLLGNF
jgi:hypothetical protein